MAIVHSSKFGLLFWSVIIVVISGWPGSMVHELSSFLFPASSSSPSSSHILVAAVSPPLSLSSSSMSMVRMSTDGKSDDEGMIMIADGENSGSRSSMSDVKAVAGQSLQLLCPIFTGTGQNVAASEDVAQEPIYWMKGTTRLPINKRQEVYDNGTLILREIQKVTDDGIYTCTTSFPSSSSSKSVSKNSASFRVIILVGPMIVPFEFPKSIQQGMRARLLCSIMQGDPPFTFSWFKDGRKLDPSSLSLGLRNDDYSSDLTFHRLTTKHNGNYSCLVKNDVASISHSTNLFLDVPPYWKIEPKEAVSVIGGQNVLIDCLAEGSPSPSVTWERGSNMDNSPLSSSPSGSSSPRYYSVISSGPHFEVYPNGSLLIKNSVEEDSGFYLCQASNSIGPGISKLLTLTVHVAPRFTSKFESETVRLGDKINLKCEAIGDNPMSVTWFMDNKSSKLRTDDPRFEKREEMSDRKIISSLKIDSVQRKDSSLFTCSVSNAYGEDEMNIRLIVQEPPEAPKDVRILEVNSRSAKISWSLPFSGNNQISKYWITCHPKDIIFESGGVGTGVKSHGGSNGGEKGRGGGGDHPSSSLSSPTSASATIPSGQQQQQHVNVSVDSVSADEGNFAIIRGLKPATIFLCSVRAENDIGLSPSSHHIEFVTDEEAPGGPPLSLKAVTLDSRTVNVTWKAPEQSTWNGALKGYYIGYKVKGSQDQYLYKTVESQSFHPHTVSSSIQSSSKLTSKSKLKVDRTSSGEKNGDDAFDLSNMIEGRSMNIVGMKKSKSMSSHHQSNHNNNINHEYYVILNALKPFTEYTILVQAYNSMGAGPRSDEVTIQTDEDVPSSGPTSVRCSAPSSESLFVTWDPPPTGSINGLLQGYKVSYRPLGADMSQVKGKIVSSSTSSLEQRGSGREGIGGVVNEIKVTNLLKFTNYSIEVRAFNRKSPGMPSKAIYCRTSDDVPGAPSEVKAVISSPDSAIITWKDPINKNGLITKYTLNWRELNKNRTKTAVTVPKSRTNIFSTRYRVPESHPQYKLTGLVHNVIYEAWVSASTRVGEGPSTGIVTFEPVSKIPARILELSDTWIVSSMGGDFTPFVLACHVVGSDPIKKSWTKDGIEELKMEPDGSLFIQSIEELHSNFTCSASNLYGSDTVTYQLIKEFGGIKAPIGVKVTSSSYTSAQVTIYRTDLSNNSDGSSNDADNRGRNKEQDGEERIGSEVGRGYELYYRTSSSPSEGVASSSASVSSSSLSNEWQVKPIFFSSKNSLDGSAGSKVRNETIVLLDNLICGTTYHVHVVDLESGSRSETITFRTQGSAPSAPKKEQVLRIVNDSSIYIYPGAWDQSVGCPITKLTIEYRSVPNQPNWKLLSSSSLTSSDDVIELSNLVPKNIYSVRMTAHTKGSPSTMAEYEARLGLEEESSLFELQRGINGVIDTTTLVSLVSSLIVLIAGCIAVGCLILYKRKLNEKLVNRSSNHYRKPSSTSSIIQTAESSELLHRSGGGSGNPGIIQSGSSKSGSKQLAAEKEGKYQVSKGGGVQQVMRLPPPPPPPSSSTSSQPVNSKVGNMMDDSRGTATTVVTTSSGFASASPCIRGKLPKVSIPRKQLEQIEADIFNEYEEITPYATFKLHDHDDRDLHEITDAVDEEFKTFSVTVGEPAYCFKGLQGAIDVGIIPTTSRGGGGETYKYRTRDSNSEQQSLYYGLNNHSITSGSSNHTELLRAYDYGKLHGMHRVQTHHQHQPSSYFDASSDVRMLDEDEYTIKSNLSQISETPTDPPTDPGIRQFTKSPPRPNERRIGGCFTPGRRGGNPKSNSGAGGRGVHRTPHPGEQAPINFSSSLHDTEDDEDEEDREDDVSNEEEEEDDDTEGKDSERAHKSGSSDEDDDDYEEGEDQEGAECDPNGDTCSSTSDGGDEESSRTSMTPTNEERVHSVVKSSSSVFGAIPRDRSRRPSWTFSQPAGVERGASNQRFKVASNKVSGDVGNLKSISQRRGRDGDEEIEDGSDSESGESIPVIVTSRDPSSKVGVGNKQKTKKGREAGSNVRKILSSFPSGVGNKQQQSGGSNGVRNVTIKTCTNNSSGDGSQKMVKGNQQQRTNKNVLDTSRIAGRGTTSQQQSSYHGHSVPSSTSSSGGALQSNSSSSSSSQNQRRKSSPNQAAAGVGGRLPPLRTKSTSDEIEC